MSEDAYKRRLRIHKRKITAELRPTHRVHDSDGRPFHLMAYRGRDSLAIRICFGHTEIGDILDVSHEPLPNRCRREIRQVSDDGRTTIVAKIDRSPK